MSSGDELSFEFNKKGELAICYAGEQFLDTDVTSVWYRKPDFFTVDSLPVKQEYMDYAYSATKGHADLTKNLFTRAMWVSGYNEIKRASNKALQLMLAHKIGFNVPDTLMTSSPEAAQRFIERHQTVIVKTLASIFAPDEAGRGMFFFARKLHASEKPVLSGLEVAPAVFQQLVDVDVDVRVTVVYDRVFAAAIKGSAVDQGSTRDWRVAHFEGDIFIEEHTLPKFISDKCIALVKMMGLKFGAIDLVRDKSGRYWFLENNPNGQWAFVEEATGQSIGEAIAELLERGCA